jgi:hypothetical protein
VATFHLNPRTLECPNDRERLERFE